MALPSSGPISFSNLNTEFGRTSTALISLQTAAVGGYLTINVNSAVRPDGVAPHSMSEFRGYDQQASGGGPTLEAIFLGYSNRDSFSACSARASQYFADTPELAGVTMLFDDSDGRTPSVNGFYSDGNKSGFWDGTVMDIQTTC